MTEVARYLKDNYYTKYAGCPKHLIPDQDTLVQALDLHKDKVVVVLEGTEIKGVAIFLTLSDETYSNLESYNVGDMEVLGKLLQEKGQNLHFIVLTANGLKTIIEGMNKTKKLKPKTISWWNPTMTHLHQYKLN